MPRNRRLKRPRTEKNSRWLKPAVAITKLWKRDTGAVFRPRPVFMARIPDDEIERLKRETSLEQLVSGGILRYQLRRS